MTLSRSGVCPSPPASPTSLPHKTRRGDNLKWQGDKFHFIAGRIFNYCAPHCCDPLTPAGLCFWQRSGASKLQDANPLLLSMQGNHLSHYTGGGTRGGVTLLTGRAVWRTGFNQTIPEIVIYACVCGTREWRWGGCFFVTGYLVLLYGQ